MSSAKRSDRARGVTSGAILGAAILAMIGGCGTVVLREEQFENEARTELRSHYDTALAEGWAPLVDSLVFGNLTARQEDTVSLEIEAGDEVGVLGSCDEDCGDLNLAVYGPEWSAWAIDSDVPGEGKYPFASGHAAESGTYRVIVQMPNCRAQPCYYAVWFLERRRPAGTEGETGDRPADRAGARAAPDARSSP